MIHEVAQNINSMTILNNLILLTALNTLLEISPVENSAELLSISLLLVLEL